MGICISAGNLDGGVLAVSAGVLAAQSRWTEAAVTFCRLIAAEVAILPVEVWLMFRDVVNSTHVSALKVALLFFFPSAAPSPPCYPPHANMGDMEK